MLQGKGAYMAAKGGSADPTPRSADAPHRSADLTPMAHGPGREAMAVESGGNLVPALFLAPRPLLHHYIRGGTPPHLENNTRDSTTSAPYT